MNLESNKISFVFKDNIVYKLISLNKCSNKKIKVIYLPSSMINSLMRASHDDPMTGSHFATDRMYLELRTHFWWSRTKITIQRFVKSCSLCAQFNLSLAKSYGHLRSIPSPEGPFTLTGFDFC